MVFTAFLAITSSRTGTFLLDRMGDTVRAARACAKTAGKSNFIIEHLFTLVNFFSIAYTGFIHFPDRKSIIFCFSFS
jgi:hypothetical protein